MRWLAVLMLLAAPIAASAYVLPPPPADANQWHTCETDADCILIPGPCGQTAVNQASKQSATDYYKPVADANAESCKKEFWVPKANAARCRINACEAVVDSQ